MAVWTRSHHLSLGLVFRHLEAHHGAGVVVDALHIDVAQAQRRRPRERPFPPEVERLTAPAWSAPSRRRRGKSMPMFRPGLEDPDQRGDHEHRRQDCGEKLGEETNCRFVLIGRTLMRGHQVIAHHSAIGRVLGRAIFSQ
jgi:hypothetical protein